MEIWIHTEEWWAQETVRTLINRHSFSENVARKGTRKPGWVIRGQRRFLFQLLEQRSLRIYQIDGKGEEGEGTVEIRQGRVYGISSKACPWQKKVKLLYDCDCDSEKALGASAGNPANLVVVGSQWQSFCSLWLMSMYHLYNQKKNMFTGTATKQRRKKSQKGYTSGKQRVPGIGANPPPKCPSSTDICSLWT